ncbi:MAG: SRPBCC family protein [Bacteroidetes bacterium]|nr:SRPBCC family protein [Bacteroidota bacterium]
MQNKYSFITKWQIVAPVEQVWDAIYQSAEWPNWWKGVLAVKTIEENDDRGVNGISEYTWKSILPYKLTFKMKLMECKKYENLSGIAFGELEGEGRWLFTQNGSSCIIEYHWNVFTNKKWMNYFSFLLKPAFKYNHDVVMRWGAEGLAKKLNTRLLQY